MVLRNRRLYQLGAILALALSGCQSKSNSIGSQLDFLASHCSQQPCEISLRQLSAKPFDTLYFFKYSATRADIERTLPDKIPFFSEFHDRIVLTKGRAIVLYEELPTDIEKPIPGQATFDIPPDQFFAKFPSGCRFSVHPSPADDVNNFYLLTPAAECRADKLGHM